MQVFVFDFTPRSKQSHLLSLNVESVLSVKNIVLDLILLKHLCEAFGINCKDTAKHVPGYNCFKT